MSIPLSSYVSYAPLDTAELRIRYAELGTVVEQGLDIFGIDSADVAVNKSSLLEAIERVEKRRVYFMVYYGIEMSEKNEAALYCFWILKFAPFFDKSNPDNLINVKIALHIMLSALTYTSGKTGRTLSITGDYLHSLVYAFAYRDLSKESIMAIMDSLLL